MTSQVDRYQQLDSGQSMTVTPLVKTAPLEKVEALTCHAQKVAARLQLILNSKPHLELVETSTGTTQVKLMDGPFLTTWNSIVKVIQITQENSIARVSPKVFALHRMSKEQEMLA